MRQRITDKKLKDRRFRKTEEAILRAFFSNKRVLSARVITKRARISRSTLYRHHGTVYEIIPDYEAYILAKYCKLIDGLIKRREIKIKTIYCQMLIFILRNKGLLEKIVEKDGGELIEKMVKMLEPKIKEVYSLPKNCEKMLKIYEKEITGLVESWIKNDFYGGEMIILGDIMYLSNTFRLRLRPLAS